MRDPLLARLADLLDRADAPPELTIHTLLGCADGLPQAAIHNPLTSLPSCADHLPQPAIHNPAAALHTPLDLGGSR